MYEKKIELRSRVEIILNYEFFDVQRKRKMFYKKISIFARTFWKVGFNESEKNISLSFLPRQKQICFTRRLREKN